MPIILPPSEVGSPTYAEIVELFTGRGFDYLPDEVSKRYVNDALHQLYDEDYWPFLEAETTGSTPLTIPTLKQVLLVKRTDVAQGSQLQWINHQALERAGVDLTQPGLPRYWYRDGDIQIRTWPVTTQEITVRFIMDPPELENDDDVTLVPVRYKLLVSYIAERLAYEDSDNYEAASQIDARYKEGLQRMRQSLLYPNLDSPDFVQTFRSDGV